MKLIVSKTLEFFRTRWYLVAITIVVATSTIIFFRKTEPLPPKIKASSSPDYVFETKNSNFSAQLGVSKSPRPHVSFTSKAGGNVTFDLDGESHASIEKNGKSVVFRNVNNNSDIFYTPLVNGIKEEIILNHPSDTAEYIFNLTTLNAKPRRTMENGFSRYFYNDEGRYQFHIEKPYAVDAKGVRLDNITMQIRQAKNEENKYQILISLPEEWLKSKSRSFPVTIDPTFLYDTSAEFAVGTLNRIKDTGTSNAPTLETYYQELPADQYTVGLWHFNEASGNALDSSGNSNTGTPTGTTITTGLLGNARSFNGIGDFIDFGSSNTLKPVNAITVEAWVKFNSVASDNRFMSDWHQVTTTDRWLFYFTSSTSSISWVAGNANETQTGTVTAPIVANTWYHLAGVYDGSNSKLYVNGNLVGSTALSGLMNVGAGSSIRIGKQSETGGYFNGLIDDVRISNVARSAEEIKADSSRRPYGVYLSDIIDFGGNVSTWNPLTWNEIGVATGDGETPFSTTNLVAQWNLNSTSGTTATADAGSCGSSCNGTLTTFASTASQDQAPLTGWTSANRRWGAGALMFDGLNDTVSVSNQAGINFDRANSFSISLWLKTLPLAAVVQDVIGKWDGGTTTGGYNLNIQTNGTLRFNLINSTSLGNYIQVTTNKGIADGQWHAVTITYSGTSLASGVKFYIDGQNQPFSVGVDALSLATTNNNNLYFGSRNNAANWFSGVLDSVSIYSRAITPSEVMSNYQASNIEFQTRVGTSLNSSTNTTDSYDDTTKINTGSSTGYVIRNGQSAICFTPSNSYLDADGDGYGTGSVVTCSTPGATYVANNTDCNDANASIFRSVNGYLDTDGDSYGTGSLTTCAGATGTYVANNTDCNDGNASVFRSVNGYLDSDNDGQGNKGSSLVTSCLGATGTYVANNTDCGPNNANAYLGSAYCGTTTFTNEQSAASWDWDCDGVAGEKCSPLYYASSSYQNYEGTCGSQGTSCCGQGTYYNGIPVGSAPLACGATGYQAGSNFQHACTCFLASCSYNLYNLGASGTQKCQ